MCSVGRNDGIVDVTAWNNSLHIYVMDRCQSRMWHQPMRTLRDWYQEELIVQVQEAAQEAGCHRALLYDAEETLLWQSAEPAA